MTDRIPHHLLGRLVLSQAITQFQADRIAAIWPNLDDDAFAHPYLRTVPEHCRIALEQQAARARSR